jgi:hypothetical protein
MEDDVTDILQNQLRRDSAERSEPANWRLMYASAADALAAKDAENQRITRERDEARADMEKSAKATRRAVDQMAEAVAERDAAAVTHYARGVQDAASLAHNQRSYSVAEIVSAILALLPKEKNDAE